MRKDKKRRLIEVFVVAVLILVSFIYFNSSFLQTQNLFDNMVGTYGFMFSIIFILVLFKVYLWIKG